MAEAQESAVAAKGYRYSPSSPSYVPHSVISTGSSCPWRRRRGGGRSSSERLPVFSLLAVVDVPHSVISTGSNCPWRRRGGRGRGRRRCNASRVEFGCRGQRHAGEWPRRACWVELRAASGPAKRVREAPDPCHSSC